MIQDAEARIKGAAAKLEQARVLLAARGPATSARPIPMGVRSELPTETEGQAGKLCIDLCSGLGGFSQAFVDAGWEVIRVDNDPMFAEVPHTIIRDVLTLDFSRLTGKHPIVMLMSPPCERFSITNSNWPQHGVGKALSIVGACIEGVITLKPDYWCMENPKGRLRWFLGPPPHSVKLSDYGHTLSTQGGKMRKPYKPTDLWGNIPFPLLQEIRTMNAKKGGTGFTREARAERARMPYGLSKAVLEAVSQQ